MSFSPSSYLLYFSHSLPYHCITAVWRYIYLHSPSTTHTFLHTLYCTPQAYDQLYIHFKALIKQRMYNYVVAYRICLTVILE